MAKYLLMFLILICFVKKYLFAPKDVLYIIETESGNKKLNSHQVMKLTEENQDANTFNIVNRKSNRVAYIIYVSFWNCHMSGKVASRATCYCNICCTYFSHESKLITARRPRSDKLERQNSILSVACRVSHFIMTCNALIFMYCLTESRYKYGPCLVSQKIILSFQVPTGT